MYVYTYARAQSFQSLSVAKEKETMLSAFMTLCCLYINKKQLRFKFLILCAVSLIVPLQIVFGARVCLADSEKPQSQESGQESLPWQLLRFIIFNLILLLNREKYAVHALRSCHVIMLYCILQDFPESFIFSYDK